MKDVIPAYQICRTCTLDQLSEEEVDFFSDLIRLLNDFYHSNEQSNGDVYAHIGNAMIEAMKKVAGEGNLCLIREENLNE